MLKVSKLTCGYPDRPVLEGVNFELRPGETVALVGQNGSGKSTLAEVLAGLKTDFSGAVQLDDLELNSRTPRREVRRKVSLVLQNPDNQILFPRVRDELEFVGQNLGIKLNETKLRRLLRQVALPADTLEYNPFEFSGGQKQRLAIAASLVGAPKYLILDEATTQLDSTGQTAIYKVVQRLARQQKGILWITNRLDELIFADRILILGNRHTQAYSKAELLTDLTILTHHGLDVPLTLKIAQKFHCTTLAEIEAALQ